MGKFVIKETLYSDQDSESYFKSVSPSYSGPFVSWTYLDEAKTFETVEAAQKQTEDKAFTHAQYEIVELKEEIKSLKKGFYEENGRIRFHYVIESYDLLGRGEFTTEAILKENARLEKLNKNTKENGKIEKLSNKINT